MSVFHRSYKFMQPLGGADLVKWPADIRDELFVAALLLPVAAGHIRWLVTSRLSCTVATTLSGGDVPPVSLNA